MRKFVLIFFFLIFPISILGQTQTETKPVEKAKPTPISFAIVVDNSGSFRKVSEDIYSLVKKLIEKKYSEDETLLIRFIDSNKIEITQDFTKDEKLLKEGVDQFYTDEGQTALYDAIYLANEKLSKTGKNQRKIIILITDGEDRDSYYTHKQVLKSLKESNIEVYTIGIVNEIFALPSVGSTKVSERKNKKLRKKAKELLETLAKETNGQSFIVEKKEDFLLTPEQVFNLIRPN
jgi:Ca-activated chloride channel homolog